MIKDESLSKCTKLLGEIESASYNLEAGKMNKLPFSKSRRDYLASIVSEALHECSQDDIAKSIRKGIGIARNIHKSWGPSGNPKTHLR